MANFSCINSCSDHWLYIFFLIDWAWIRAFQIFQLILSNTFKVVLSCFFIGFVKLEAIKILVWCVLGKITKSLIFTHLDFVISLYKVTNRGSWISASCNVFNAVAAFYCLPIFDNADCWEIYKEVTDSSQVVFFFLLPTPIPSHHLLRA